MSYHFEFDAARQILRGRFAGRVTDRELKDFYSRATYHAATFKPRGAVVDFSGVDSLEVSADTIRALARLAPAMPDADRPRVIVAGSAHIFGLARMFEIEGEATRPNLHVVRKVEDAWVILGVNETEFELIRDSLNTSLARAC